MKRKKILLYVTLFALILNIFNPLIVYAASKGEINNPTVKVGNTDEAGNVKVTKTVTKVDDNGRYRITFDVVGKNNNTISKEEAKPYIVYVVDRSATMAKRDLDGVNSRIYISRRISESSSAALESYYNTNDVTNVQIAAITFADDVKIERNFRNSALAANTWSGASGLNTLTYLALKEAATLLNNVTNATSKHIILLSDGLPWNGKYDDSAKTQTILEATNAKESGIEIFSVFIQEKNSPDVGAKELMDNVASLPTNIHSFEASDSNSLSESFTTITNSIIKTEVKAPAATNAILKDVIGSDFTYVPGSASSSDITVNDKNVTINIGDVNESKKFYSFDIKIDEDASTGWHKTNDLFNLTGNGLKNTVSTTDSAEVYWEETYKKLVIEKELKGISNNNTKFNFKITLKDKEGNLLSGEYKYKLNDGTETILKFVNGVATISLKDGEKVEFINIPRNTKFTVEEKTRDGYKTQVCINDNNCENKYKYENSLTDNINIKFVNTGSEYELPETGSSGGLILIITGLTFTGGAVIYILIDLLRKNRMC